MRIDRFLIGRFPVGAWAQACALVLLTLLVTLVAGPAHTQAPDAQTTAEFVVRDHYTKAEVLIPMRDGVRLYTVLFIPKDTAQPYPILLNRTPYSVPYGPNNIPSSLGPSRKFAESGFIFAYQDVRGQHMSEGTYVNMRPELNGRGGPHDIDESTDTYDTIDWLMKCVPNNNGRVGMWGISYPGFYAAAGALCGHPALKAVSPQAPIADWFIGDDDHHNGAFYLMDNFAFSNFFDPPRPKPMRGFPKAAATFDAKDAYSFYLGIGPLKNTKEKYFKDAIPFWDELLEHDTYDAYWKARNLLPHLKNVKPAVLLVGGWYDAEDFYGPLAMHLAIGRTSPGIQNTLVVGPWPHGGWAGGDRDHFGDIPFGQKTAVVYRDTIEYPFFNYYLKDIGPLVQPNAIVFETGANQWLNFDAWPPRDLKPLTLYFQPGGKLAIDPPKETGDDAFDSYVSDPASPVPYSPAAFTQFGRRNEYLIEDQRFVAQRPDVISYTTEPLTVDTTLMGPMQAGLFVSTTGTDSDFVVKVIDVYPEDAPDPAPNPDNIHMAGYQSLVRAQVMRGKFRRSFEKPEPFMPGQVTPVNFTLLDICHTFKAGHRIMVQVQSSWFPIVDRNPQTFMSIGRATEADYRKATEHIYRSARFASHITAGVKN